MTDYEAATSMATIDFDRRATDAATWRAVEATTWRDVYDAGGWAVEELP